MLELLPAFGDYEFPSPNRKLKMSDTVSAVVPVEGYPTKMVALIGRNICYVDRETGMHFTQQTLLKICMFMYNTRGCETRVLREIYPL